MKKKVEEVDITPIPGYRVLKSGTWRGTCFCYIPQRWSKKTLTWENFNEYDYGVYADKTFDTLPEAIVFIREDKKKQDIRNTETKVVWGGQIR